MPKMEVRTYFSTGSQKWLQQVHIKTNGMT